MKTNRIWRMWGLALLMVCTSGAWAEVTVSFTFDNLDGLDFTDVTGYGLQGEIVSSDLSRPASISGAGGGADDFAVSFDGKGGLVADDSTTYAFDFFPPFTIEAWARTTVEEQANTAFLSYGFPDRSDQTTGGFRLGLSGGTLVFSLYGVKDFISDVTFPADGEWHHVASAYEYDPASDEGSVRFYLDGAEAQILNATGDIIFPGRVEVSLGEVSPGFLQYVGDLDRVRVSEGVLSAEELDAERANPKPAADSTMIYFSFDETSGGYASEGSREALEAVPVADRVAQGIEYVRIPKTAEVVDDTPSGQAGDKAILFTGKEYALVLDPDGVLEFPGDWTLEAWIKPQLVENRTNAMVMYAYGAPGGGHSLQLAYSADDPTRLNVRGTAVGILDVPAPNTFVVYDEWQHVAVAHKDGESMSFFLNGALSETIEYTQGMNPRNNEFLYIGTWPNALDFAYVGTLDRIRFSDRVLTEEELDSDPEAVVRVGDWDLY